MQANTRTSVNTANGSDFIHSFVDWSAVIAGALTAAAVSLMLLLLGSGLGLSVANTGATATEFTVGAAIWLIVMQWLSSALGGYLTGRLRTKWINMHGHEVFFRDTAQGLLAWVIATLFTVAFLASATTSVISGGMKTAAIAGAGVAAGANPPAPPPGKPGEEDAYFVDSLLRSDHLNPNAPEPEIRGEVTRIMLNDLKNDNFPNADRAYLAQLVAQKTGVAPDEASRRVNNVIQQMENAKEKLKEKADTARKTASAIAIITCLSMVLGAFIASVAAALGGRKRETF